MYTIVAKLFVKPEREADFVAAMSALTNEVLAHQPDVTVYLFKKIRGQDHAYAAIEQHPSQDYFRAVHCTTPWFRERVPGVLDCLSAPLVLEEFDDL
ncbi:MAG: putative quinol monooxygenase [Niveispirillum sp.]|uniref:putative quinol monooxygenase n=1 Tax=Niveispirillum sp. TaxID=1917217 RepID=UPI003BA586E0